MEEADHYAVHINNLSKGYNKKDPPIIQNLCMSVKRGEIYALFGPSGGGKTTLLSLIVGLSKWNSGDLKVFGKTPGTNGSEIPGRLLGYMPQNNAMNSLLTFKELIQFYGRIYNMTNAELIERWDFLTDLLDFPQNSKPIGSMSGGEKRRASFGLALLHLPKLLVLDEPTVGLDPVLREKIWDYLYTLTRTQNTTILLTTHYTEEARLSNTIGVMKDGRLLVEDSPSRLLQEHKSDLFENVFLQLWNKPYLNSNINENIQYESSQSFSDSKITGRFLDSAYICSSHVSPANIYQKMKRVYALLVANFLPFKRYPLLLLVYLLLPSLEGVITLVCFASIPQGMHVGIVNYEMPNWTKECSLPSHLENGCDLSALSCTYLNIIQKSGLIVLDSFESEAEALKEVHLGKIWGFITFAKNYTQHSLDFAAAKIHAFNESIEGSRIRVRLDHSEYPHSNYIVEHLMNSYTEYLNKLSQSCSTLGRELEYPLDFRTPVYGKDYMQNYIAFTMPGAIIFSFIFIVGVVTAVLVITDRNHGTLDRAKVAGLCTSEVICGYLLTQAIIVYAQVIVWLAVLRLLFQFVILGSELLNFLMCWVSGICGAALGIFGGMVCKNETEATVTAVLIAPFLLLYGGIFWPTEMMPWFWQQFGYLMPTSLPTMSLRSVIIRGLGFTHSLVWPGFLVILVWTLLTILGAVIAYKRAWWR